MPKFRGYNPLVHQLRSGLPHPATPSQQQRGGTAAGGRPSTSNPITHAVQEFAPRISRPGSSAQPLSRAGSAATNGVRPGSSAAPWNQNDDGARPWSSLSDNNQRSQVLVVDRGGAMASTGRSVPRGTGREVDPVDFAMVYPDRVRMSRWPPATPFREDDVAIDDMALRSGCVARAMNLLEEGRKGFPDSSALVSRSCLKVRNSPACTGTMMQ